MAFGLRHRAAPGVYAMSRQNKGRALRARGQVLIHLSGQCHHILIVAVNRYHDLLFMGGDAGEGFLHFVILEADFTVPDYPAEYRAVNRMGVDHIARAGYVTVDQRMQQGFRRRPLFSGVGLARDRLVAADGAAGEAAAILRKMVRAAGSFARRRPARRLTNKSPSPNQSQ